MSKNNYPYAVWFETVGNDSRPESYHLSKKAAEKAKEKANKKLKASNPEGYLLCGFSVREKVKGKYVLILGD
jgi:hypothetical protein